MKRILVPYDFSVCAENALKQAVYMAKKWNAELHIFHAAALHPYWQDLKTEEAETYQANLRLALNIESKLTRVVERIAAEEGVPAVWKCVPGPLIERVAEYVRSASIELMVIGTHGMSGVREWVIGSNAQKILRLVHCPVLAIKHDLIYRDFKDIAFVSDFKPEALTAFGKVVEIATLFGSSIYLINMDESGFFGDPLLAVRKSMREFEAMAQANGISCQLRRLPVGDLEEGLLKEIKAHGIDLVALATHGKGGLARIFQTSLAEGIVNHLDKPVLTVRV